jgi:hypothetical protein
MLPADRLLLASPIVIEASLSILLDLPPKKPLVKDTVWMTFFESMENVPRADLMGEQLRLDDADSDDSPP